MAVITHDEVRNRLVDYKTDNIPLNIEYVSDEDIDLCIERVVDDFNETPPIFMPGTNNVFTVANFPYKSILLKGACYFALDMTAKRELRREMQYSDGGVTSSVYYKTPQFTQMMQEMKSDYETAKLRMKRHINIQGCYGGIP